MTIRTTSSRINAGRAEAIEQRAEIVTIRGNTIPLVRLDSLFGLATDARLPTDGILVIVESEGERCCLMVDEILGEQQVVIKSLGEYFQKVDGISGGAILGDGRIGLILDVSGIMQLALAA